MRDTSLITARQKSTFFWSATRDMHKRHLFILYFQASPLTRRIRTIVDVIRQMPIPSIEDFHVVHHVSLPGNDLSLAALGVDDDAMETLGALWPSLPGGRHEASHAGRSDVMDCIWLMGLHFHYRYPAWKTNTVYVGRVKDGPRVYSFKTRSHEAISLALLGLSRLVAPCPMLVRRLYGLSRLTRRLATEPIPGT